MDHKAHGTSMKSRQHSADSAVGHEVQTGSAMKLHQLFTSFPPYSFSLWSSALPQIFMIIPASLYVTEWKIRPSLSPARVQIQVCITSMKVCSSALHRDAKKFLKCLWIQEILLVSTQSCTFLSVASAPLIIYIDCFDFPDLVQFSQIPTNNPNAQTNRNNFVCQASKQNAHTFFFSHYFISCTYN